MGAGDMVLAKSRLGRFGEQQVPPKTVGVILRKDNWSNRFDVRFTLPGGFWGSDKFIVVKDVPAGALI